MGCATGLGSVHAPVAISLVFGLAMGFVGQRSRFCTMAAVRDYILMRDPHLLRGLIALVLAAFATNLVTGYFQPGFQGQPEAHTKHLLDATSMVLTAGGGRWRGLSLASLLSFGEGDADAGCSCLDAGGARPGAHLGHRYATGPTPRGLASVLIGLAFCVQSAS